MGRSKTILNRDAQWNEVSRLGRIYVSSEVIMYSKNLCVKRSNNVFD